MSDWIRYPIKPLQHGMETDYSSIYTPFGFSPTAMNVKIDQHSVKKPWGYSEVRDLGSKVYNVILYQLKDGSRYTVYLTATDACAKKTGTSETFSYITDTYTTGTITGVSGPNITGDSTAWSASTNAAVGDKFIIDSDHSANIEPDTDWGTISDVGDATHIQLSSSYTGAATTGTYKVRKVYSVPSGERWSHATVDDKLCFTNGDVNVQYWNGTGYATDLDATYATKARYCIEFANRLWLADLYDAGIRDPYLLRGSKEGDPTNWTDDTAVDYPFIETDDIITGLGKGGNNIFLYKKESILIGGRSSNATDPLDFDIQRRGTGCVAPGSIMEVLGTNVFLGRDDFYIIDGDYPKPIGEKIRHRFYDIVDNTEAEKTWGFVNHWRNECIWFANTSEGQYAFVWDYKTQEWFLYQFPTVMTGAGTGAV
jgi:hypothetical protein